MRSRVLLLCASLVLLGSCAATPPAAKKITVAAAANLTDVMGEIGPAFKKKSGIDVVLSYSSTAQLAQQIDNGAPFDVFAAADKEHVDGLVKTGKVTAASRAVYARGQLALWIPKGDQMGVHELKDLTNAKIRFIAIAQPSLAPYGRAAEEALRSAGLYDGLQPKFVYGNTINLAKQLASSGNADVCFTAYSLVLHESGAVIKVEPNLYKPIEQALAIVAASTNQSDAQKFDEFLLGADGRSILEKNGYILP
jgi:molybdate transport system substrate-binding protein